MVRRLRATTGGVIGAGPSTGRSMVAVLMVVLPDPVPIRVGGTTSTYEFAAQMVRGLRHAWVGPCALGRSSGHPYRRGRDQPSPLTPRRGVRHRPATARDRLRGRSERRRRGHHPGAELDVERARRDHDDGGHPRPSLRHRRDGTVGNRVQRARRAGRRRRARRCSARRTVHRFRPDGRGVRQAAARRAALGPGRPRPADGRAHAPRRRRCADTRSARTRHVDDAGG